MYDTWGKLQYGVFVGNVHNFGDYDRCIDFEYQTPILDVGTIQGRHCMISYEGSDSDDENLNLNFDLKELLVKCHRSNAFC